MKLGVSSCLLGTMCRYDGGHSKDKFVLNELGKYFDFEPFCPEKLVFATPREAIRQVKINDEIFIKTTNSNQDVTILLSEISKLLVSKIDENSLCGFVFKSKSPTCGMQRVKIYSDKKNAQSENTGMGVFSNELKKRFPYLPMEEEGRLTDPWLRENFLMQVFAYKAIFEFLNAKPTYNDLIEFHTSYKYLIYSKSHHFYKKLGNVVANHDNKTFFAVLEEYKEIFLEAISQKGTIKNTYNVLLHIYGYFKKVISKDEKDEILATIEEFKKGIIPLITVIKIIKIYIKKFNIEYLQTQVFLTPYPKEFALRSKIEAFK
jgi:uncharacterized protein YbgA (DUF1722 family)/uncharacterized protein YbbK (DUF523 family)